MLFAALKELKNGVHFQLPLSGSPRHYDILEVENGTVVFAFNSLSRDHLLTEAIADVAGARSFQLPLSGSLALRLDDRDRVVLRDFQLPLSGSLVAIRGATLVEYPFFFQLPLSGSLMPGF